MALNLESSSLKNQAVYQVLLDELNWTYNTKLRIQDLNLGTASYEELQTEISEYTQAELPYGCDDLKIIRQWLGDLLSVIPPVILARIVYYYFKTRRIGIAINRHYMTTVWLDNLETILRRVSDSRVATRFAILTRVCDIDDYFNGYCDDRVRVPYNISADLQCSEYERALESALDTARSDKDADLVLYVLYRIPKEVELPCGKFKLVSGYNKKYVTVDDSAPRKAAPIKVVSTTDKAAVAEELLSVYNTLYQESWTIEDIVEVNPDIVVGKLLLTSIRDTADSLRGLDLLNLAVYCLNNFDVCIVPVSKEECVVCDPRSLHLISTDSPEVQEETSSLEEAVKILQRGDIASFRNNLKMVIDCMPTAPGEQDIYEVFCRTLIFLRKDFRTTSDNRFTGTNALKSVLSRLQVADVEDFLLTVQNVFKELMDTNTDITASKFFACLAKKVQGE